MVELYLGGTWRHTRFLVLCWNPGAAVPLSSFGDASIQGKTYIHHQCCRWHFAALVRALVEFVAHDVGTSRNSVWRVVGRDSWMVRRSPEVSKNFIKGSSLSRLYGSEKKVPRR